MSQHRPDKSEALGFTLIELLVAVAVVGLLTTIALPNFNGYIANQRAKTTGQDLYISLNLARSEAIKRNSLVSVCPVGGNWSKGWEIVTGGSTNCDPTAAGRVVIHETKRNTNQVVVTTTATDVVFRRSGRTSFAASFEICPARLGNEKRVVKVDYSGRPLLSRGGNTC